MTTYAFIDSQNLKKSVTAIGKEIDYHRFRLWLQRKYGITRAFMYFGHLPNQQAHYDDLKKCGFELCFRQIDYKSGRIKANVDIFLTISMLDKIDEFNAAYLVSSDGDFYDLTERLKERGKLGGVISPSASGRCSRLLKRSCGGNIAYIPDLIHKFEKR